MPNQAKQAEMRAALIALLERGQAEEQAYRAALSEAERNQVGTAEQWAPKEVVAHLALWKNKQLERVDAMARGEELPEGGGWGQLNTETWPEHAQLTWDESVARSDQAMRDLIAGMQRLPLSALEDMDDPASQASLLVSTTLGNGLGHVAEHVADYYRSRGQAERARRVQEDAVQAVVEANLGPGQEASARYNLACYYALHGLPVDAISELGQAFAGRPDLIAWSREDHDLDSLRADPAFQALVPAEEA
jgi:hypothetical protein